MEIKGFQIDDLVSLSIVTKMEHFGENKADAFANFIKPSL